MKIKCQKIISFTTGKELEDSPWITLRKEYTVLTIIVRARNGVNVLIQSDNHLNEPILIPLLGFEITSNYIPSNWGSEISENNIYSLIPESWMYDGFLEDLEDQEPKAMELFKKEAWIIYEEEEKHGRK